MLNTYFRMDRGRYILQLLERKDYEAAKVTRNDDDNSSISRFFNDKNLCESAPQSINTTYINNNTYKDLPSIEQPKSAPLPTNIPNDLLPLQDIIVEENINLQDNQSHSNQIGALSPYSNISGVEPLSSSPCPSPFSDSSDSWIPNSDEEPYVRNMSLTILSSSDKSDDIEHTEILCETVATRSPNSTDITPIPQTSYSMESLVTHDDQPNPKRWKKSDPTKWKKNISKKNMYNCLPYENKKGKMLPPKHPKPIKCYPKCRYKCSDTFEESDRVKICEFYWRIGNFSSQKQYLLSKIVPIPIQRIKVGIPENRHRKINYGYHFEKDGVQHRVCKDFFLKTLCISNGPVNEALKHKDQHGNYIGLDKRGCQTPINKISPEAEQRIVEHINSFPRLESHYCRKKSKRQYLDCKLSIAKMYELYKETLESEGETPCSLFVYRRIFGTKFNLSFFKPKKDLCIVCTRYESSGRLENLKEEYDLHIARKNECQAAKQADKERSINDSTYLVVTADMQSTLQIPVSDVGVLYYTRKLNVQNYTIYTAKPPNDAYCILWNEINGKRGSVEIATSIDWWLSQIPSTVKEITMYSDTCAGQNRNQFIAAYLLHLVQRSDNNLEVFEQKYLESGHTHMEVDSMHSAIEKEQRHSAVYSMIDWKSIMMRARSKRQRNLAPPYNVQELHYQDMLDVRAINEAFIKNINRDKNGDKVMWLKIKCMRFDRKYPGIIQFRYSHEGPYLKLDALKQEELQVRTRKRNKSTQELHTTSVGTNRDVLVTNLKEFTIPRVYSSALPISEAKKKDLISLCTKGIIPHELHSWYHSLPTAKTAVDRVGGPEMEDEVFDENILL